MSSLLRKIQAITRQSSQTEPVTTAPTSDTTLINHTPGTSPTESMATLISETLSPPIVDQTKQTDNQQPIPDQPHVPIDIPITTPPPPPAPVESKKCPVCNYEFASTSDDVEMYDHIEKCLFPTGIHTEPKDYECPNCNRKYPGNEETEYLQHLSDCYNRDI